MSHIVHDLIARGEARVVDQPASAPVRHQVEVDRNFGLPTVFYAVMAACYVGFLVITVTAFASPLLIVPMAVIGLFLVMFFGIPTVWTRFRGNVSSPETLGEFEVKGIMTNTGPLRPRDAAIQMLILPVLLVLWGLAVVIIAAIVA
ncbi:hypothetical protein [Erythrobacter dokdonensis]|jgi:hypothetical protein|uniref:Uncharacterized protein n=1 Tax=Erythrobacter dokdonensis DSW-74 TaxID=1300349 RepID=A0A1A7BII5_9SPHN|nr:hypothetical protein [Erythrobacter dokdonensis]MEE4316679.1 hypothetical protein [Erythrobacter sp.]OBV11526.1 hypothetical protein I603_0969 [Erythrobacter dokdonensis DSW-74]